MSTMSELSTSIIDFENGDLTALESLELFGALVKSGQVWHLQGCYGRQAVSLIEGGLLTPAGELTDHAVDLLSES